MEDQRDSKLDSVRIRQLDRIVLVQSWGIFVGFILSGTSVWASEGNLINTFERLYSVEFDENYKVTSKYWQAWKKDSLFWNAAILSIVFAGKILILSNVDRRANRASLLLLLFVASILIVWFRIATWATQFGLTWAHHSIGEPVTYLAVPFAFAFIDVVRRTHARPTILFLRSILELVLMVPWAFVWTFFELMFLGWIWI